MKYLSLQAITGILVGLLLTACNATNPEQPQNELSTTAENRTLYVNQDLDFSYEVPQIFVDNDYYAKEQTREIEGDRTWEEVRFLVDFESWPEYRFISIGRMKPEIKDFIAQKAAEAPEGELSEWIMMNDTDQSLGEHSGFWYYYNTYNQDIPLEIQDTPSGTNKSPEELIKIGL